jgi:thiol-disulfide isomerase/thioredoxin
VPAAVRPDKSFASEQKVPQTIAMNYTLRSILACLAFLFITANLSAESPRLESGKARDALNAMHGKPAPVLALKGWINSKPLDLNALNGKIVVLDFWATWCGPCISAVPHTNEMKEKYAKKGVVIIGVCNQRGSEKMAATVKAHGIKYPVAVDAGTNASYKVSSYPDYYLIDRKGILRWADVANSEVEKAIEILLKEQPVKGKK